MNLPGCRWHALDGPWAVGRYWGVRGESMKATILAVALGIVAVANAANSPNGAAWFWRTSCGDQGIAIDVTFASKSVYHTQVPICRMVQTQAAIARESDGFTFSFTTTQPIVFSGYRVRNEFLPTGASLVMNVWQAAADPDRLTLGVSVADAKEIYANTLYFAKPDAENSEEIGTGLVITTRPVRLKP
jgi:hypothetical protein